LGAVFGNGAEAIGAGRAGGFWRILQISVVLGRLATASGDGGGRGAACPAAAPASDVWGAQT